MTNWRDRGLPLFLIFLMSVAAPVAVASPQTLSGTKNIPVNLTNGNSVYSIYYSYPASAQVGGNVTVTVSLGVVSFTGDKLYVRSYALSVLLPFANGKVLNRTITVTNASPFVYAGGSTEPANLTLGLTPENTGLPSGQSTAVNVTVGFTDEVWYEPPVSNYYPEFGSAVVGSLLVQSPSPAPILQPVALMGAGVVLLALGLLVRRRVPKRGSTTSPFPAGTHLKTSQFTARPKSVKSSMRC